MRQIIFPIRPALIIIFTKHCHQSVEWCWELSHLCKDENLGGHCDVFNNRLNYEIVYKMLLSSIVCHHVCWAILSSKSLRLELSWLDWKRIVWLSNLSTNNSQGSSLSSNERLTGVTTAISHLWLSSSLRPHLRPGQGWLLLLPPTCGPEDQS